jgi:hypothetical protein
MDDTPAPTARELGIGEKQEELAKSPRIGVVPRPSAKQLALLPGRNRKAPVPIRWTDG